VYVHWLLHEPGKVLAALHVISICMFTHTTHTHTHTVVTTQRRPITQEVQEADRRERARQRQELGTFEIWTDRELGRDWSKLLEVLFVILLVAEIGFSVGKLFPGPSYLCDSWSCRKVTHECLLTLCPFPLQLLEFSFLFLMMKEQRSKVPVLFKIADYSAALAYVVYGAATQKPPGVGTIVLVVITCMAEVLLIAIEAHIFGLNFGQFRMVKSISNCYRQPDLELSPVAVDPPPTEPVASAQMRRGIETLPFASSADLVCSSGPNPTVVPLQPAPVFASQNDFSDFKSSFGGFGGGSSGGDQPSFGGFGGGGFGGGFGGGSSGGDQPSFGGFGGGNR
jgi:hypothetical protein